MLNWTDYFRDEGMQVLVSKNSKNSENSKYSENSENSENSKHSENSKNKSIKITFGEHPNFQSLKRSIEHMFSNKKNCLVLEQNVLYIVADSIENLSTSREKKNNINIKYNQSLHFINSFSKQLSFLFENEKKGFYTFDPNKFVIINNSILCYLSINHLKNITEKQTLEILSLPESRTFLSPELRSLPIDVWPPIYIHFHTIYHSFAQFLLYFLDMKRKELQELKELEQNEINVIYGTKLHDFIQRCLKKEIENRSFFFI